MNTGQGCFRISPRKDEVPGSWWKLPSEEFYLYSMPNNIRVIKLGNTWGRTEMHVKFWLENLQEGNHLQYQGTGDEIILKWTFKEQDVRVWTLLICLSVWVQMADSHEHDNESFIKKWKLSQVPENLVAYYELLHVLISMYS